MLIEITYNVTDVYMSTTETPVYVEISFEQPGGTSAVWGSITGTLSNQTDLQNALNLKVPYTGATTNVDLGEYELKAGQLTLDTTPTGTAAVGTTRWNDTIGSSETTLKGGSVVLKNGVDLVARIVNKVTPNTTLTKAAYQAVRVSGAQGQRLAVALAQANNDANSADTIGLVTETIPTNQEGFIITVGQLENINTTGSLQGETWVDGDVLYLSPTTAGAITNVKPTGAGHIVVIGYVEYAHQNNGKIYVKVMNGWELEELHDVDIVSPANNEALIYESSTSLWKNKTIATALGFTPVPTSRTITINGVTFDLSADRSYTVAAGISGSGASGQVTYWTGSSAVSGSSTFLWNAASNLLRVNGGIGVNRDAFGGRALDITGGGIRLIGSVSGTYEVNGNNSSFTITTVGGIAGINIGDTANARISISGNSYNYEIQSNASLFRIRDVTAGNIDRFAIHSTGNIGIGFGSTDPAVRFGVTGDTLLRGSGATSATTALTVQNSSSTNLFTVRNDGISKFGSSSYFDVSSPLIVGTDGAVGARISIANNSNFQDFQMINTSVASGNINCWAFGVRRDTFFGNTIGSFQFVGAYVNNSGSGSTVGGGYRVPMIFNPNGDVLILGANANVVNGLIGLKVNAPTAHVDITASTTGNASLRIRSGTAPTSPNDGDIWFDGTNIQMRIGGVTKTFTLL